MLPPPPLSHIKLIRLAELTGFPTKEALLNRYISDGIVPGICMNPRMPLHSQCRGRSTSRLLRT